VESPWSVRDASGRGVGRWTFGSALLLSDGTVLSSGEYVKGVGLVANS
jgi:hypothetical protein